MIIVIADDFTGAAEIAGLGLRYNLKVEIESHIFSESDADLLIIATDTRSLNETEAFNEVLSISKRIKEVEYEWLYKKTDSVFRGHIFSELYAILESNGYKKALLVPANPSLGRYIKNGTYFIGDKYLHETNFAEDPEFALTTSNVLDLLESKNDLNVRVLKPDEELEEEGIFIGEAESDEDLYCWTQNIDPSTLPAGGAGFFESILRSKGYGLDEQSILVDPDFGNNYLFVCGSAFSKGKEIFKENNYCKHLIYPMPNDIFNNTADCEIQFNEWSNNIIETYKHNNLVVVEIDQPVVIDKKFSKRLRESMAKLVRQVLDKISINELLIEGGATVNSIAEEIGIQKFLPIQELAPGVIRMKVEHHENLYVTIKPGSYSWPKSLLNRLCL